MNTRYLATGIAALAFAALLQGCGGGGSSSALPPSSGGGGGGPVGQLDNSATTYAVFIGTAGGASVVDVEPYGAGPQVAGAQLAQTGAYVVYPDNSVQAVDALGNFDVSRSSWAASNVNILLANPNNEPTVDVFSSAPSNPAPEEVAVAAYAPGAPTVLASNGLQVMDVATGTSTDLAHVTLFPQSTSLLDNRTKLIQIVGANSDGGLVPLNKASVIWSLTKAAGCGAAAGSLKSVTGNASVVVYVPPKSGSASNACPDQIVGTVSSGATSHSGSANAYYYDPATSATVAGVLKNATGSPAANAVINLYGGSSEAQKGALLVSTDGAGKFSRLVPTTRVLSPTASLTSNHAQASFVAVNPSSINPATAGAALASQTWAMTATTVKVAPKPQPPYQDLVRNANFYGNAARDAFPFGAPDSRGQFAAGSIEYVLAHPAANQTGMLTSGSYAGYKFAWNAAATTVTFTQQVPANAKVLAVTINASTVNGAACPSGSACFSFTRKIGSALDIDGNWSQKLTGTTFATTYVRNEYNGAHQTAGSPLYSHTISTSQTVGTQTLTMSDQRFNASKKSLGTVSINRVGGTGSTLYTYSGTVKSLSYKSDGSTIEVDYAINSGVEKTDYSGSYQFVISASPSSGDVGDGVNYVVNVPSAAGNAATGTIDGVGLSGLASGHAASFVITASGKVTITKDASLGSNVLTFQL